MKAKTVKKWGKPVVVGIFVVYLAVLAYFLFFSERYGRGETGEYHYNLIPLQEIKRFIKYRDVIGWEGFIVNIFGNVLAFAPFGFLLPIVSKQNRTFFCVVLYSFEFSLFIELIQLSFQVGTFDVDDLLMNTMGGMLGYLFFLTQKKRLKYFL
ncbi:MAG: VanZ family protein [Clostridiales bacterium]|nr:VanZ family protein [Clostridiales bacterium]